MDSMPARETPNGDPAGPPRTIVKVCGITRMVDARVACDAGADWLGFVVAAESPRRIDPARAAEIAAALPQVVAVVVLVGMTPDRALDVAERAMAQRIQIHRVDALAWPADFPLPVTFAVPVAADGSLTVPLPREGPVVLLDSADEHLAGGTGRELPWETARIVAAARPVLLAGGLDGANVAAALERVRPFGVDASSRLESAPGIKDEAKVRRYVSAVRAFDGRSHAGA